ncbi:hypothetical protein GYMLUDRAFT_77645 [Collybiopsis luxurians FD-317 M1]|uniref:Uncharacterized protein n=1 Tax=Collybiopsis luxurians FD-317 M1 TaxID=944289 RepID=A0A0D0CDH9_9AGAR|nr:hypothetical protein GYMLUDRAFT_77645 [Collybiopsis luxurians FD-317 M1]
MAQRLNFDPSNIPRPDFSGNIYVATRRALIADNDSPDILTEELAIQHLEDQWETENAALRVLYQVQLDEERQLVEQRRQEAIDLENKREAEKREKESELAKKAEEKRTPLHSFTRGIGVISIPQQIHPYAKKMMITRKYVPLWYLLPEAAAEAKERSKDAIDANRFQIAMDDVDNATSSLSLVGSHAVRASPNAIPDSRLTWDQVMRAKSAFLSALPLGEFTNEFVAMFAGFYTGMDMHPEMQEINGDRIMAHYHAEMRRAWYDAFERRKPFDLAVFSERTLEESRVEIQRQNNAKALKEMQSATAQLRRELQQLTQTPAPHTPSPHSKTRPAPYPPTSPRKASGTKNSETTSFQRSFRNANQAQLARCHRCLCRDKHDIRRCTRTTLSGGKRDVLCNWNSKGYLEITHGTHAGLELCAEWQRPNGCTSRKHPEKHRCSGCASTLHGAEGCPDGQ